MIYISILNIGKLSADRKKNYQSILKRVIDGIDFKINTFAKLHAPVLVVINDVGLCLGDENDNVSQLRELVQAFDQAVEVGAAGEGVAKLWTEYLNFMVSFVN